MTDDHTNHQEYTTAQPEKYYAKTWWISHLETGEGSGLWSLFALTYAENTVTHILGGKGNGRVVRGLLL